MQDVFKKIALDRVTFKEIKNETGKVIDIESQAESREYLLIFNIKILDIITNRYKTEENIDGYAVWAEKADNGNSHERFEALSEFLIECVNAGIDIENRKRREYNLELLEHFEKENLNLSLGSMMSLTTNLINESTDSGKN